MAKRLEAINISMLNAGQNHNIRYKTHVQSYGWQNWVNGGVNSGTSGMAKRLEAIQIELKGSLASQYDIYYRVHTAGLAGRRMVKSPEQKDLQNDWKLSRSYW
jgi:uncharacterized protein YjdB